MNEFFSLRGFVVEDIIRSTLFTVAGFGVGFVCGVIFAVYF